MTRRFDGVLITSHSVFDRRKTAQMSDGETSRTPCAGPRTSTTPRDQKFTPAVLDQVENMNYNLL